jgi:DNA polymerase eta
MQERRTSSAEKASIDEAFLDLSLMVNERMLQQFPYLAAVPPDAPDGLDSLLPPPPPIDWTKAGQVFPVGGEGNEGPMEEEQHEEERSEDGQSDGGHGAKGSRDEVSWEDWALCIGAEIMAETRNAVWTKLHYTCSAVSLPTDR